MSSPPVDDYRELAAGLTPLVVQQYLAANDWQLEAQVPDVRQIWRLRDEARVMLPLATDYIDFAQRFRDTLRTLATVYDWDPGRLAEKIIATRADLFFVRFDQMMVDGTLPFRQAEKALDGLFKMMKAAATSADDPTHSHRGRRSSTVTDFLDEDVRLGHTKRGSFVFTVVTRLGDPLPAAENPRDRVAPFPRRVMETLASGLSAARDLALNWDPHAIEQAVERGLSANLVESLQDLTEGDSLRELDLSFDWAVGEPLPDVPTSRIVVNRDAIVGLPRVRERLVRREEPPRTETVVGQVRSLTREESGDDQEETTIVLSAEIRGRTRKIHVPLSGDDYDWAIFAHRRKLPFTVTGNLAFERGAWRLTGRITVDPSFLQHQRS